MDTEAVGDIRGTVVSPGCSDYVRWSGPSVHVVHDSHLRLKIISQLVQFM
jgi:hypothetical protein